MKYDLLNLSPPEFEDLTRDVLQRELSLRFETFTNGRDNGIDLRYSTIFDNSQIIVQCKRYSDFRLLYSNLKKEKKKVIDLLPERYILSTTVGLTPNQKNKILSLLSPYIISTSDIYGKDDINNLISLYPEIERKNFKLWLSSTTILEKILHSKVYNQSNFEIETIENVIRLYVDNDSYYRATEIIKDNKFVIISGIPGIGKTTLAKVLVYHYLASGFDEFIYLSDSINEGYSLYRENSRQVFLFDDFLGTNFLENKLSTNEDQRIIKFIEKVSKAQDKILIFTTREYILAQAKQKYDAFNNLSLEFAKCIIDLSQYTRLVKARILYNHLFFSNISEAHISNLLKNKAYISIINHKNYNPRIIETITKESFWQSIEPTQFSTQFLGYLNNPQSIWSHVFENQISKLSQIVLLNMMACGSPILLEDLWQIVKNFAAIYYQKYNLSYSEIDFSKSLKELENTFIKILKDKENQFALEYQNPSIQDFLVFYFETRQDMIKDLISCSNFFNQFFTVFVFYKNQYLNRNVILLSEENKEVIIKRILNDFDLLSSSSLSGSASSWYKRPYSDIVKLYDTARNIQYDDDSDLKIFAKNKLMEIIDQRDIYDDEFEPFIYLIEEFQYDIDFDVHDVIRMCAEHVIDSYGLETFERLESFFGEKFEECIARDEHLQQRIITILEITAEHTGEDFEYVMDELISKANKYNLDYTRIQQLLQEKIENEQDKEDSPDWSDKTDRAKDNNVDDRIINNMFDSLSN